MNQRPARMTCGEVISLRKRLGLTQVEFADILSVSVVVISQWENHHHQPSHVLSAAMRQLQPATGDKKGAQK